MWTVDVPLIEERLGDLDDASYQQVIAAIELLTERGPQLGRPIVDTVAACRHKNMKALRPGSAGSYERSTSTGRRNFLVAGDKAGNWKLW